MLTVEALETAIIESSEENLCRSAWGRSHYLVDKNSGRWSEINCRSWRCPKHRNSWRQKWYTVVKRELENYPIDRLITLTCASKATPQELCLARQLLARDLRTYIGPFEYFSVLEFTSKTRLPHLHILARSVYIDAWELSALWERATISAGIKRSYIVYIEKPRSQEGSAFYALSYALAGVEKGQDIPADWGGRKVSYSKGFFHKTVAEYWRDALAEYFGPPDPDANWIVRANYGLNNEGGQPYVPQLVTIDTIE